jgi:4-amino-4-deoxy-L-arabinose transferase-like glycosyltransferase
MTFFNPGQTKRAQIGLWVVLVGLLGLAGFIRLLDLTDPPIDFHPSRQLRNAVIARGIYYQILPNADPELRQKAIALANAAGRYEPPILETIVAWTYRVMGGEYLWVSRIYSTLFWLVGGLVLFLLGRRMTSVEGALVALSYYLFLPFSVQASRSFQPDPQMVMWFLLSVYFLYRWSDALKWKWAILAGLTGGMAVLVKIVAVYLVGGAGVAVVLSSLATQDDKRGLVRRALSSLQVWVMVLLMVIPPASYYLAGRPEGASGYFTQWITPLAHLILNPSFYVRWISFLHTWLDLTVIMLGLVGVLLSLPRNRTLLLGLWIGYGIYGLTLPYQMYTHNYYHIQLIPIVALSIAPVAQVLVERLVQQAKLWQWAFIGLFVVAIAYSSWVGRSLLMAEDFRSEPAYWQEMGKALPADGKIIALTNDYGLRLLYYGWRNVGLWPSSGEQDLSELRGSGKDFQQQFANRTAEYDYFLVTAQGQLNKQPELSDMLSTHYPVVLKGDGYIVFDLRNPL